MYLEYTCISINDIYMFNMPVYKNSRSTTIPYINSYYLPLTEIFFLLGILIQIKCTNPLFDISFYVSLNKTIPNEYSDALIDNFFTSMLRVPSELVYTDPCRQNDKCPCTPSVCYRSC